MQGQDVKDKVPGKHKGLTRIIKAGGYSLRGLRAAWHSEAAFRQECLLALLLIPAFLLVDLTGNERILLVGSTVVVIITELLNSAIESVVDRIGTDYHELSGKAKDIGSAAVLCALLLWGYVWIEILLVR